VTLHNAGDDLFVRIRLFGCNQRSNVNKPQGIGYGKGFFSGFPSAALPTDYAWPDCFPWAYPVIPVMNRTKP
jgi:hypothetical protein